jgi:endonuclease YncB( thermonuclease family)
MPNALLTGLLLALGAAGRSSPETGQTLPFIQDDYPRALAEARSRKLPLFIEAWAPW